MGIHNMTRQEYDAAGRPIVRGAATNKGWHYCALFFEYETSLGSFYCRDHENNDLSSEFSIIRFSDETTTTTTEASVVKDLITWLPSHDYDLIGGKLRQASLAASDVRVWTTGGMYDEASNYSVLSAKQFINGGTNLSIVKDVDSDGRASKFMRHTTSGAPYPTNRIQWTLRHAAGVKTKLTISLELFKA